MVEGIARLGMAVVGTIARTAVTTRLGQGCILAWVNGILKSEWEGAARMLELKLDPKKKTISVKLDLAGEPEPVTIQVKRYSLREGAFTVEEIEVDRPWMDVLARKFLVGQEFEIPEEIGTIINRALA